MPYTKKIEDVQWIEDSWDRSDNSACNPCCLGIDDLGALQCMICLRMFSFRDDKKYIISLLRDQFIETWEGKYKELKEIRSLVWRKRFDKIDSVRCAFRNNNGTIKTVRYFYEKSDSN